MKVFVEKPGDDEGFFFGLEASPTLLDKFGLPSDSEPCYLANMGVYVFNLDVLERSLDNDFTDFGREVLPSLLDECNVRAHLVHGYWEDIGTI